MTKKNDPDGRPFHKVSAVFCYWLITGIFLIGIQSAVRAGVKTAAGDPHVDSVPENLPAGLFAQPKIYAAPRAQHAIKIDGRLEDPAWQAVKWSDLFSDIAGISKLKGIRIDQAADILATRVKMCWDAQFLYIAAELKDQDLWATLRKRDTIIYHNNDFEAFFTTSPDVSSYYELEINQLGTVLDLMMTRPYRNGGRAVIHWDLKGLQSAVQLHGTVNNPEDKDSSWTVEMAIPFSSVLSFGQRTPARGTYWRMNFSRVQWDLTTINKRYERKTIHGRRVAEHNWVWSPQGIVDMHAPDRWGYLFFTNDSTALPVLPFIEKQKAVLWKLYYLQKFQFARHQKYALTLRELGVTDNKAVLNENGQTERYTLHMNAGKNWFRVALVAENGDELLALDQNGLIRGERQN